MRQKIFTINTFIYTGIFIIMLVLGISYARQNKVEKREFVPPKTRVDTIDTLKYRQHFHSKSPQDGLMEALIYYDIKHPHIVYSQALIETGNFKSDLCLNNNNLFGLYNSNKGKYHEFDHWTESVIAYKKFIQYRHKPPEDYYKFLQRIGYAKDPNYINKLKRTVNNNDKRRSK